MRRLLALLLPLLLLVTACSSGSADTSATASASVSIPPANAEALASVKVEDKGKAKAPTVTFDKPLAIAADSMKVVSQGDGAQLEDGQIVSYQMIALNAEDGTVTGETFTTEQNSSLTLNENFKTQFPMVYTAFLTAKVGSYIAYGIPGTDAVAGSTAAPSAAATPAALSVFKVTAAKAAPSLMSAEDVSALEKEGKLPVAEFNDKGVPSITIPKNDAPADLAVQVLTEGTGEVLKESDSISALYTGWTWSDGKQFDSAFDRGEAATFSLQGVIPGWTKGLAGQKVGSIVQLSIPSELAYGENAAAEGNPAGALVFVVKIEAKS
ncbi:FKBP-type peptidyl-prolyl cis-trans isomerase [Arthrobacter sp. TWP1-1]|uniref:FKBP-type peptidyl-prolyl cis-trans isomerase n=1 Tax=Arthrobacter sp. TWP1-1 TaxID=2804568 RepID=UPI003CFA52DB